MNNLFTPEFGKRVSCVASQEWWLFGSQYVDGENSKLPVQSEPDGHGVAGAGDLPGFRQRVWSYFRDGIFPDDNDTWRDYREWAWSGAFISYCYRMAGAGDAFPYSPAHHAYVMVGIHNRANNRTGAGLVTYGIKEQVPNVGDMLWKGRMETKGWTLENLLEHARDGDNERFRSHCDIVTAVDPDAGSLHLIGGNVRNRVLRLEVPLDDDGYAVSSIYTVIVKVGSA